MNKQRKEKAWAAFNTENGQFFCFFVFVRKKSGKHLGLGSFGCLVIYLLIGHLRCAV